MGWLSFLLLEVGEVAAADQEDVGHLAAVERRDQVVVGAVGLDLDVGLVVGGVVGVDDALVGVGLLLGAPDAEGQVDLGGRPGRRRAGGSGIVVVTGAAGHGGAQHEREGHHDPPAQHPPSSRPGPPYPWAADSRPLPPVEVHRTAWKRFASATTRSKTSRLDRGSLAADRVVLEDDQPVQAHLARPVLGVPAAGADVHPVPPVPRLLLGVPVVVLAGQHQPGPVVHAVDLLAADQQHRAVLALARVLLEGHPAPDHLAGVRLAVCLGFVRRHLRNLGAISEENLECVPRGGRYNGRACRAAAAPGPKISRYERPRAVRRSRSGMHQPQ